MPRHKKKNGNGHNFKHENVILLNMSILNNMDQVSHYHYINGNHEYRFNGISQLEPGTKYILTKLAMAGEKVDRIVVMSTNEAIASAEFYKTRIINFCSGKETVPETAIRDERWISSVLTKIHTNFALYNQSNEKIDYMDLVKIADDLTKEELDIASKDYNDMRNKVLNSTSDDIQRIEKELEDIKKSYTGSIKETRRSNLISKYTGLSETIKKKQNERSLFNILYKKELSLYYEYSKLCIKYQKAMLKLEKADIEISKIKSLGVLEHNKEREKIKGLTEYVEMLSSRINNIENHMESKIRNTVRELVYREYCNSDIQIRTADSYSGKIEKISEDNIIICHIQEGNESSLQEIVAAIRGNKNPDEIRLFIDMQGGNRWIISEMDAVVSLLTDKPILYKAEMRKNVPTRTTDVKICGRYAVDFKRNNISSEIKDATGNYNTYTLVSAMTEFKRYGSGLSLVEYFKSRDEKAKELAEIIDRASFAIILK